MTNRRYPRAKWVLPVVVNPPTHTDWCVPVPDDRFHRAAFLGALQDLGSWYQWQEDPTHKAKQAAKVWRDIIEDLQKCMEQAVPLRGTEIEDFMPLRVDCDCNVFVTCCDGTEKQILTSAQVTALILGQPGDGSPQPKPGGGCQTYHAIMQANGKFLVPATVSTGDTIEVTLAKGAGNDGSGAAWRCYDGLVFFGGVCVDLTTALDGGDPLPTSPHMGLLIDVAGNLGFAPAGIYTVPGGVSNEQPVIYVNDSALSDNFGEYQFDVTVCNNGVSTWSHTIDLVHVNGGWIDDPLFVPDSGDWGSWAFGTGWVNGLATSGVTIYQNISKKLVFSSDITFDSFKVTYDATVDPNQIGDIGSTIYYRDAGGGRHDLTTKTQTTESASTLLYGSGFSARALGVELSAGSVAFVTPAGALLWYKLEVTGHGTDPF